MFRDHVLYQGKIRRIGNNDQFVRAKIRPPRQRLAISEGAGGNRRSRVWTTPECNSPCAAFDEMLGNYEAGTAIVDSHQIVAAAARVIVDIAIEQDDRNLGLVEDPGDAL